LKPAELFEEIVRVAPSFATVRRAHIEDYGELLAHVLMGDLLRFVQSHFSGELREGAAAPTQVEMQAIFDVLDQGLDAHETTENAIAVSFVEGIEEEEYFNDLERFFGPLMREELERQRSWRPPPWPEGGAGGGAAR